MQERRFEMTLPIHLYQEISDYCVKEGIKSLNPFLRELIKDGFRSYKMKYAREEDSK